MNNFTGIIAMSLLVCSLAAPAWAELSESAAAGEQTPGHPLSAQGKGSGEAGINSLLDRLAGTGLSDPSSKESYKPSIAIVPPISETTLFSAFTRADSPMNAYYSRAGSDDKEKIMTNSRSAAFAAAVGGDRFVLPDAGLAASVQGHFVGSGAVVDGSIIAPIQISASDSSLIQTNGNIVPEAPPVPLPLPFLFTGSGLAALLALRKRAWKNR